MRGSKNVFVELIERYNSFRLSCKIRMLFLSNQMDVWRYVRKKDVTTIFISKIKMLQRFSSCLIRKVLGFLLRKFHSKINMKNR